MPVTTNWNVGLLRSWRKQGWSVRRILRHIGIDRNRYYYLIRKSQV